MTPRRSLARALHETVLEHLLADGSYALPGFGVWRLRMRPARRIRHPVTRELVWLPSSPEVRFTAFARLKRGVAARLTARAGRGD